LGRFLSADTIVPSPGNPQSLNRYSYVLNAPLNYVDPTGHAQACAVGDEGGGCGGQAPYTTDPDHKFLYHYYYYIEISYYFEILR
jgi:hypothetical protein